MRLTINDSTMGQSCKICNSIIHKQTILKNSRTYNHCDKCGFISLESKFILGTSEEKSRYDLHQNFSDNSGYLKILEDFIVTAVQPYAVKTILDYGSGPNPLLSKLLKEKEYDVDIYDPHYAPWGSGKNTQYDMIVSTETFEHFQDPLKEMNFICTLLKPQAYLSIMTSFACPYEEFKAWRYKDDATHVAFYSMATFQKLAELFSMSIIYGNQKNIVVLKKLDQAIYLN